MPKQNFMELALLEAKRAGERGEVPVGAVMVRGGAVIASAGNQTRELRDPTAHAEILAIRQAAKVLKNERLDEADLYVTLEPCAMCAAAVSFARVRRLYYGADDVKGGGVANGAHFFTQATCHHAPEVYAGVGEEEAAAMLREFFQSKRA